MDHREASIAMSQQQDSSLDEDFFCFSLSRHPLQRSQDSGALTDWSRGSVSPARQSCKSEDSILSTGSRQKAGPKYVTVVSVNDVDPPSQSPIHLGCNEKRPEFVTVLSIGGQGEAIYSSPQVSVNVTGEPIHLADSNASFTEETVSIQRLCGEKLGLGLKFDGGLEHHEKVKRLFVQCCAPNSPASRARCTWGCIAEADEIIEISGVRVGTMTRAEVIKMLTEGSSELLYLTIRHVFDDQQRDKLAATFLRASSPSAGKPLKGKSSKIKKCNQPQERAVDVPVEYFQQLQSYKERNDVGDCPPPVPPRRKRRSKVPVNNSVSLDTLSSSRPSMKTIVTITKSLVDGGSLSIPSKPPRKTLQHTRSWDVLLKSEVSDDSGLIKKTQATSAEQQHQTWSTETVQLGVSKSLITVTEDTVAEQVTCSVLADDIKVDCNTDLLKKKLGNQDVEATNQDDSNDQMQIVDFIGSTEVADNTQADHKASQVHVDLVSQYAANQYQHLVQQHEAAVRQENEPQSLLERDSNKNSTVEEFVDQETNEAESSTGNHVADDQLSLTSNVTVDAPLANDESTSAANVVAEHVTKTPTTSSRVVDPAPSSVDCCVKVEKQTCTADESILGRCENIHVNGVPVERNEFPQEPQQDPCQRATNDGGRDPKRDAEASNGSNNCHLPDATPRTKAVLFALEKPSDADEKNQKTTPSAGRNRSISQIPVSQLQRTKTEVQFNSRTSPNNKTPTCQKPSKIPVLSRTSLTPKVAAKPSTAPSSTTRPTLAKAKSMSSLRITSQIPKNPLLKPSPEPRLVAGKQRTTSVEDVGLKRTAVVSKSKSQTTCKNPRSSSTQTGIGRFTGSQSNIQSLKLRDTTKTAKAINKRSASTLDVSLTRSKTTLIAHKKEHAVAMETTTLSRLPPDGHEFPSSQEDLCGLRPRTRSGLGWRRDERSEKSVRDKIALFTNDSKSTNHKNSQMIPTNDNENKSVGKTFSYSVDNLAVNSSPKFMAKLPVSSTRTEPRVAAHKQQDHSLLNERSRSLLDVTKTKRNSLTQQRKDSFIAEVADQKRKSISKLRGLVIPANGDVKPQKPIVDMPEIISKDSVLIQGKVSLSLTRSDPLRTSQNNVNVPVQDEPEFQKKSTITFQTWKSSASSPTTTIPKYSPAFKRKELTLAASQQQRKVEHSPTRPEDIHSSAVAAAEEIRRQQEETSDTDSAVSSSRSSFSPSGSPVPSPDKDDDPIDESGPRVLKPSNVEALNRKNVLQSARFSCGGTEQPVPEPQVLVDTSAPLARPSKLGPEHPTVTDEAPSMSPASLSPIRSRKGSMDFEQILKRFSDAEKPDMSPSRNRKLTSESITSTEIKSACITEVLETSTDPSAFAVYSKEVHNPNIVKYAEGPAIPTPIPRKISSEVTKPDWKKSPSKASPCPREEPTTFRALAERWQAITEGPGSSQSKPASPCGTLKKPEPPTPAVRRSIPDKSTQVESEILDSKISSRTSNNVLEIRKAFERVKGELETESSLNSVSPTGASDELDGGTSKNIIGCPHAIFTPIPFSSYSTSSYHARMSSLDSNASEDNSLSFTGSLGHYGIGVRDNYGSITSLASSTSLISPQELQQLIEEANQSLEESGTPSHEIVVVVLHRGEAGPASLGLGITLAGGADYETKEITVHKVIAGSVADKDGRIQKGDRVLSINGKSLKGVTHREALSILKAPRPEVVLVLSRNRSVTPQEGNGEDRETAPVQINLNCRLNSHVTSNRPPRILESPLDNPIVDNDEKRGPTTTITLFKDGAGLGFSLEGGRDSPLGDRPLTVKKIFTGGSAAKNGILQVGDEIIGFNGCDVTGMSRIEAWNFMKKLPDGAVTLVIRQNQP